jgi:hypothetical protein
MPGRAERAFGQRLETANEDVTRVEHQSLTGLDKHVDGQVDAAAKTLRGKGVDGLRTGFGTRFLPDAKTIQEYEKWRHTPGLGNGATLADFYKSDHRRGSVLLDQQLTYLEETDEQLHRIKADGMKADVVIDTDGSDQALRHAQGGKPFDPHKLAPTGSAYLTNLKQQAKYLGTEAAETGVTRVELGNEPNDPKHYQDGGNKYVRDPKTGAPDRPHRVHRWIPLQRDPQCPGGQGVKPQGRHRRHDVHRRQATAQ